MKPQEENRDEIQFLSTKVEQLTQQLKEQSKFSALGKNITYIIHEICSPLGTIEVSNLILSQLIKNLLEQVSLKDNQERLTEFTENTDRIEQSVKRINELIASLKERVSPEDKILVDCNLERVIDEALDMTIYSFCFRQDWNELVKINKNYDFNLTSIKLYRYDFERAICNLIENSLYSLKEKKIQFPEFTPRLTLSIKQLEQQLQIIIEDNGRGIKPEDESKIFDEFYTTKGNQGTGIGLFIVKEIIELQHQGVLTLETSSGDFARFIITLPQEIE